MLVWPLHGRILTPDVTVARTEEDVESFMRDNPERYPANDPVARQVGYVSYRRKDEGKSDVLRIPIALAKELQLFPRSSQASAG